MLCPRTTVPSSNDAAIAARLPRVRRNLTDAEFAHLVAGIAMTAERFEEIEGRSTGRRTPFPGSQPAFKEPGVPG